MRKVLVLVALVIGIGATQAWASTAYGCPAAQTALSTYLASGFSCQIGDKTFSDFSYSDSGMNGLPIGPDSVIVETLGPLTGLDPAELLSPNIGFEFSAGWSVSASCVGNVCTGAELDSTIGFTVTVVNGANMVITDAALAQTSSGASGQGAVASVTEGGCSGAACTPGAWNTFTFIQGNGSTKTADQAFFTGTGSVTVVKDVNVTAGAFSGSTAALSIVEDTFAQTAVPEPGTLALVGIALCGVAAIGRRRKK